MTALVAGTAQSRSGVMSPVCVLVSKHTAVQRRVVTRCAGHTREEGVSFDCYLQKFLE